MKMIVEPNGAYSEQYYGFTKREVKLILPYIRNAARHAENMVEHYQDILESGEATDRQTTALAQWEDKMDIFNSMIAFME